MKIDTIHEVGDLVWFIDENKIKQEKLYGIDIYAFQVNKFNIKFVFERKTISDSLRFIDKVFKTKEELAASL